MKLSYDKKTRKAAITWEKLRPIWKYRLTGKALFEIPHKLRLDITAKFQVAPHTFIDTKYFSISPHYIIAKAGYCWDGPTGARDTETFMRGSLFHDIVCQAIDEGLLLIKNQKRGDKIMDIINREDGMRPMKAWLAYRVVRGYQRRKHAGKSGYYLAGRTTSTEDVRL